MEQQVTAGGSPIQGPPARNRIRGGTETKVGEIVLQGERWLVVEAVSGAWVEQGTEEWQDLYCRAATAEEITAHQVQDGAAAKKNARGYATVLACTGLGLIALWGQVQAYWVPLLRPPAVDLVLRSAITLGVVWLLWTFFRMVRNELRFEGLERYTFDVGPDGKEITIGWQRRPRDGIWEVTSRREMRKRGALIEAAEKVTDRKEEEW